MSKSPYTQHTLENGLRIVVEQMPGVKSAAAGFMVETGARNEVRRLAGVSHFLEHMMFKGTSKRTWRDITVAFDEMGSSYNAYTSEDRTVYYGWVREADLEPQIELLADMLRSTLPVEEFEMERNVILEEIAMSKDSLDHVTFDFLQEKVFAGHPLAWPVLGYDETVRGMQRDDMWDYFQQRYAPDNVTLIVTGRVNPQQVIDLAQKYCGHWAGSRNGEKVTAPKVGTGVATLPLDRFKQQVIAICYPAVSAQDARAETASAAASILGGANSRYYWNIMQTGIALRAGAFHLDYADSGLMILFGTCAPESAEQLTEALRSEAKQIAESPVATHELDRVKNKRRTGLAIEAEAPYHRLSQLMDDLQFRGGPRTVDQMLAEVDGITPESVLEYFREFPIRGEGFLVSVGPRAWPEVN